MTPPDENPYLEEVTPDTQDVPARIGTLLPPGTLFTVRALTGRES